MSKPPVFGEGAKGHRGRPSSAFELPVHLEGNHKNMKTFPPAAVFLALAVLAPAQQDPALSPDGGEAPTPEARAVFSPGEALSTTVTRQGGRDIIVQHLALDPNDPIQPVLPPEPVAVPAESPPAPDSMNEGEAPPAQILLLSATVHSGPRTFLSWTHVFADGTSQEFSGWSNVDFNHFTGSSSFRATDGTERSFVMGIGTTELPAENGPEFTTDAPTFVPDGDFPSEALVVMDSLHRIYATKGERLAAAHAGRERARIAQEAWLAENPPQPKDLIIRYRVAETPLPTRAGGNEQ